MRYPLYIDWEDNGEISNEISNDDDIANLCLLAKNHRKQVNDDELNFLPIFKQLQNTFEELHGKAKNMTKLMSYQNRTILHIKNQIAKLEKDLSNHKNNLTIKIVIH